ncbi:phage tail protein [Streptomyces sp. NBC_00320]|uniref:phage tail protein n=1 Tax=Streptomyces sp. NBC_00320 TaxID=2975711 RepID=UPI002254D907|nr:phage tail protein [Streptomyces sp. NBC_00320]MCX5150475.1 phage tail protein [Streptomyces sp. NBC_00320]
MPELVQTFRFRVRLTRSATPGRTAAPPPPIPRPPSEAAAPGSAAVGPGVADRAPERLGDGGFQECAGLALEADVREYLQGGANDEVVRRVGRVRLQPLVLKRGMLVASDGGSADTSLWDWLHGMVAGGAPVPRYDGDVEVLDPAGRRVVAHWTFVRGLPLKITGPTLNARTGEIAVEELHIAHEGLRLERTP